MKAKLLAALSAMALIGVTTDSYAVNVYSRTGVAAWAGGRAAYLSDETSGCFVEYWGGVKNTCATTKTWEVPIINAFDLSVTSPAVLSPPQTGYLNFESTYTAAGNCFIAAWYDASDGGAGPFWWSSAVPWTYHPAGGGYIALPPGNYNAATLYCAVPPNASLSHARFTQDRIF